MTESATSESAIGKQRHGCLAAWVLFSIAANALTAIYYAAGLLGAHLRVALPMWTLLLLAAVGVLNVVCLFAVFRWKKWGFWGLLVISLGIFALNIALGVNPVFAVFGLAGPAILFGVLNIGDSNKGWVQLE